MSSVAIVRGSTVIALAVVADAHAAWAFGSPFPARDRRELADLVAGNDEMPGSTECLAVAGLLGAAAVLVADVAPVPRWVRRSGVLGVSAALGGRSVLGFTGRAGAVVPWTPSERFAALDRRWYAPLCAALAAGSIVSLASIGERS